MDDTRCRQFFLDADPTTYHRRYEALRAVFVEGLPQIEVAARFGFTHGSMRQLVHEFRAAIRSSSPPPFFKPPSPAGRRGAGATTGARPAAPPSPTSEPRSFTGRPPPIQTRVAGIFAFWPLLAQLGFDGIVKSAGYPGSGMVPATSAVLEPAGPEVDRQGAAKSYQ